MATQRKTAGLQLLLDLLETFLHFIYDNPFNYATSDRVSVLLRQRNIRKILKSQAKSRQMPQNTSQDVQKKKKCEIECVYLWLDLNHSQPFISLARSQMELSTTSHTTKQRILEFGTFIFPCPCQRRNRIFVFALFPCNSLPVFDIRLLFIGINVHTLGTTPYHDIIIILYQFK